MTIKLSKRIKALFIALAVIAGMIFALVLEINVKEDMEITEFVTATMAPQIRKYVTPYDELGRLDINMATKDELVKINGIGDKLADRIIGYRETNGPFRAIEELTLVNGIGDNMIENIRDKICVR